MPARLYSGGRVADIPRPRHVLGSPCHAKSALKIALTSKASSSKKEVYQAAMGQESVRPSNSNVTSATRGSRHKVRFAPSGVSAPSMSTIGGWRRPMHPGDCGPMARSVPLAWFEIPLCWRAVVIWFGEIFFRNGQARLTSDAILC